MSGERVSEISLDASPSIISGQAPQSADAAGQATTTTYTIEYVATTQGGVTATSTRTVQVAQQTNAEDTPLNPPSPEVGGGTATTTPVAEVASSTPTE